MLKLMNSAMMPQPGRYMLQKISVGLFAQILSDANGDFESYIGYPQTAEHISCLAGVIVPVSREPTRLADGDEILVCKLAYRVADPSTKGQPVPEEFEYFLVRYQESLSG